MSFFAAIIIGGISGWLAGKIMGSPHGVIINIILGLLGGAFGGWLGGLIGLDNPQKSWIGRIVISVAGACALIAIARFLF